MNDTTLIACVLSPRAVNALARCGIKTVDQIRSSYPHGLLRVHGFGMLSLRAVETAFFPGERFEPEFGVPMGSRTTSVLSEELAEHLRSAHSCEFGNFK